MAMLSDYLTGLSGAEPVNLFANIGIASLANRYLSARADSLPPIAVSTTIPFSSGCGMAFKHGLV
jgi:hypothetical protein